MTFNEYINDIFIVGEHRDFKFGVKVDHSKSQCMDDKLSMKPLLSCHMTHLNFLVPQNISGMA